jgi:hypothetical protein
MRENRTSGTVPGASGNRCPYGERPVLSGQMIYSWGTAGGKNWGFWVLARRVAALFTGGGAFGGSAENKNQGLW